MKVSVITEIQIINILKASPGLRILHFANYIDVQVSRYTAVAPAQLDDLEVLNIEYCNWEPIGFEDGRIVRWVQPGVKPLRFTFVGLPTTEIIDFFRRSNITRFYSQGCAPSTMMRILRITPRLQTLVLNAFNLEGKIIGVILNPTEGEGPFAPPTQVHINTLYLLGFNRIKLSDIQEAVDRYSVRRLFLWTCDLSYRSAADENDTMCGGATSIRTKLSEIKIVRSLSILLAIPIPSTLATGSNPPG
ncbi:hypothetical protein FRC11_010470, partial [Ceratobasidium sp. 423]